MYPNSESLEEISMSDGVKSEDIESKVKWIAFKQQFFTSAIIAKNDFANASLAYQTQPSNSGNIKNFSAKLALPYTMETK